MDSSQRFTMTELETWRKDETATQGNLRVFRRYARGEQGKPLTREMMDILGRQGSEAVADNVCRLILTTAAARLELLGFHADDEDDPDGFVQDYLDDVWMRNSAPRLQYDVHYALLRDGNHAVSMRWRPGERVSETGRVTWHREPWWDGRSGMFVAYSEFDEPLWAFKEWEERDVAGRAVRRRTIYYADLILRYALDAGEWVPLPDGGVIPWLKRDGTALGLPVIHFANSSSDDSLYGLSDLIGLIGLQDDLNAIQRDMTAAAAFAGFQMLTATGVNADTDELAVGPGRILKAEHPQASFGVIPPGDMSSLVSTHGYKRQTMAVDSSTPIHFITGQWPSGAALSQADTPLVDKVTRLTRIEDPAWVLLAHRTTEMGNAFGNLGLDENVPVTARWSPPERVDAAEAVKIEQARVDVYTALQMIDDPVLLTKTGLLSADEVDEVLAHQTGIEPATIPPGDEP